MVSHIIRIGSNPSLKVRHKSMMALWNTTAKVVWWKSLKENFSFNKSQMPVPSLQVASVPLSKLVVTQHGTLRLLSSSLATRC